MGVICHDLKKYYRRAKALDGLNCALDDNAIIGLIGPNGAGKSTLLRILAGYYRPTAGEVTLWGQNPWGNLQTAGNTILIDERMVFPEGHNLGQILDDYGRFYPYWQGELAQNLAAYFELNLTHRLQSLSKGTQAIFRGIIGLCANAPLTLLDEPTSGMDAGVRADFYRALLKSYLQTPRTIILSSHLLNEMEDILEYILLINHGQTVLYQSVEALRQAAYRLNGPAAVLDDFLQGKNILRREQKAADLASAVVYEPLPERLPPHLTAQPLSAHELCVCLTGKKEGIDHVFKPHQPL